MTKHQFRNVRVLIVKRPRSDCGASVMKIRNDCTVNAQLLRFRSQSEVAAHLIEYKVLSPLMRSNSHVIVYCIRIDIVAFDIRLY
jgi:hypothetical protein